VWISTFMIPPLKKMFVGMSYLVKADDLVHPQG